MAGINFMFYFHIATGRHELIHCTRILSEKHSDTFTPSQQTLNFGGVWLISTKIYFELRNMCLFSLSMSFKDLKHLPEKSPVNKSQTKFLLWTK
jgi:hypothetical protein